MNAREPTRSRPMDQINITPFVDVCLVILLIFMVITLVIQSGFQTQLPKRGGGGPSTAIVLQIFQDGRLSLNRSLSRVW